MLWIFSRLYLRILQRFADFLHLSLRIFCTPSHEHVRGQTFQSHVIANMLTMFSNKVAALSKKKSTIAPCHGVKKRIKQNYSVP